jgi:hypothetical protein
MSPTSPTLKHPLLARAITREEALSLRGALGAALRESYGGGRPVSCECGTCTVCKRRAKRQAAK